MGTMLSEGLKSRDSLKLSFNRSISEPGHAGLTTCPMAPLTSPPSLGPSLHPPKRCRMDGLNRSKPLSLAPPSSPLSYGPTTLFGTIIQDDLDSLRLTSKPH